MGRKSIKYRPAFFSVIVTFIIRKIAKQSSWCKSQYILINSRRNSRASRKSSPTNCQKRECIVITDWTRPRTKPEFPSEKDNCNFSNAHHISFFCVIHLMSYFLPKNSLPCEMHEYWWKKTFWVVHILNNFNCQFPKWISRREQRWYWKENTSDFRSIPSGA